jgi:predicted SAM-dependent methyltransferase
VFTSSGQILNHFRTRALDAESQSYIGTHAKRYAFLLERVAAARSELITSRAFVTILDIGPSFFTELLRATFPKDNVLTLGFDSPESRGGHFPGDIFYEKRQHLYFNLNDAQYQERWIKTPPVDLAVMAEVLEHLYTAPTLVLAFVYSLLRPGGFLIVETPNAASLKKRLKLLVGRHPYEMTRENSQNPGHFREYTKSELLAISRSVRFEVRSCELSNYFSHDSSKGPIERFLRGLSPPSLRRGITLVLQKRGKPE